MCFDWLFNLQVPASTDRTLILGPTGKTFVTGLACSYDEEYDHDRLKGHLTMHEFTNMMERLNDQLSSQFPCLLCWSMGYICCPLTLGLSLMCPAQCVNDAEEFLEIRIRRQNRSFLNERGIEMVLRKQFGTSWIELRLPETPAMQQWQMEADEAQQLLVQSPKSAKSLETCTTQSTMHTDTEGQEIAWTERSPIESPSKSIKME